jgi:hypothetical protein
MVLAPRQKQDTRTEKRNRLPHTFIVGGASLRRRLCAFVDTGLTNRRRNAAIGTGGRIRYGYLGRQELEDEPFVFGAQHGSNPHLTNHGARFARRQVFRRVMAPSAIRAESFRAFRSFIYFRRSLLRGRVRLLRTGAGSQSHKQQ